MVRGVLCSDKRFLLNAIHLLLQPLQLLLPETVRVKGLPFNLRPQPSTEEATQHIFGKLMEPQPELIPPFLQPLRL